MVKLGRVRRTIAAIPQQIASDPVVGQVCNFRNSSGNTYAFTIRSYACMERDISVLTENSEPEDADDRNLLASVHLHVPEHGHGYDDGEEKVGYNVTCDVGVAQCLNRRWSPASAFYRGVPLDCQIGTLKHYGLFQWLAQCPCIQ